MGRSTYPNGQTEPSAPPSQSGIDPAALENLHGKVLPFPFSVEILEDPVLMAIAMEDLKGFIRILDGRIFEFESGSGSETQDIDVWPRWLVGRTEKLKNDLAAAPAPQKAELEEQVMRAVDLARHFHMDEWVETVSLRTAHDSGISIAEAIAKTKADCLEFWHASQPGSPDAIEQA